MSRENSDRNRCSRGQLSTQEAKDRQAGHNFRAGGICDGVSQSRLHFLVHAGAVLFAEAHTISSGPTVRMRMMKWPSMARFGAQRVSSSKAPMSLPSPEGASGMDGYL